MDISVLISGLKGQPEVQEQVNAIIENPECLQPLLEALLTPDVQNNRDAFWAVSTALKEVFRRGCHENKEMEITDEFIIGILTPLIQLMSNKPTESAELLEISRLSINISSINVSNWMLESIHSFFSPESNDFLLINMLKICYLCSDKLSVTNPIDDILPNLVQIFLYILDKQKSAFNPDLVEIVAKLMKLFIAKCVFALENPEIANILQQIIDILQVEKHDEATIRMKSAILKLISSAITTFSFKFNKPTNDVFKGVFNSTILPHIVNVIVSLFPYYINNRSQLNDQILTQLINIATTINKNYGKVDGNVFMSEDFIVQYILPASILSNDQIIEYFMNPIQYLTFELGEYPSQDTVRSSICLFLEDFNEIDFSSVLPGDDVEDIYEKEARFFLFQAKTTGTFAKKGKKGRKAIPKRIANPIHEFFLSLPISEALPFDVSPILSNIDANIGELRNEISILMLIPTIMLILRRSDLPSSVLRAEAWEMLNSTNETNFVMLYACTSLLNSAINLSSDFGDISCADLITKLLSINSSDQKISVVNDLLHFVMENFDEAKAFSVELLQPLVEQWQSAFVELTDNPDDVSDEAMAAYESLVDNISEVVRNMPVESLGDVATFLMNTAADSIKYHPDNGYVILKPLVGVFNRIAVVPSSFSEFLGFIDEIINLKVSQAAEIELTEIASILINIITKMAEFRTDDSFAQLILSIIERCFNPEAQLFITDIASIIVVSAALISVRNDIIPNILPMISTFILNYEDSSSVVIAAAAYVFTTALSINLDFAQLIPGEVVEMWIANTIMETDDPEQPFERHPNAPRELKNMKVWLSGLCYLTRVNQEVGQSALVFAGPVANAMNKEKQNRERHEEMKKLLQEADNFEEEDFDEENFEEEDEDEFIGEEEWFVDKDTKLPCESLNPMKLFLETFDQSVIPPKLLELAKNL